MEASPVSQTIARVTSLFAPPILGTATYVLLGDFLYAIVVLLSTTIVSLVLIRYVLIDPRLGRVLSATTIVVTGFFLAASIALSQSSWVIQVALPLLKIVYPNLTFPQLATNEVMTGLLVLATLAATLLAAKLILQHAPVLAGTLRHASDLTDRQLQLITRTLTDHLDALDEQLSFFDFRSASIDPKLEELNTTSRYVNVRSALEVASSARAGEFIVVKGEPGSGKSVMLRNLTRQLLEKAQTRGKLPLLLNLRDWSVPADHSPEALISSLNEWVKGEYRRQSAVRTLAVTDEEFEQLYAEGGFILLFDSFDENAAVSNSPHHGQLIKNLSHALAEYVRRSGGCVGLVFSREYKAPSAGWVEHRIFGVRPFSDRDIRKYVNENCEHNKTLLRAIFGSRPDLYSMAKTPLLLALLVDYSNKRSGQLPETEFDVFATFITGRIAAALKALGHNDTQRIDTERCARRLANELLPKSPKEKAADELGLSVLSAARLVKMTSAPPVFTHKRFQEYFRVSSMLLKEIPPPSLSPSHIDENRDVLSLYAQICSRSRATSLRDQAFENVRDAYERYQQSSSPSDYETIVLNLRFLRSAFRNRPSIVDRHRPAIRNMVIGLWNTFDLMKQKHSVEHLALLPPKAAAQLIRRALEQRASRVRRVALSEARYVSTLQPWLGRCVAAYFSKQDDLDCHLEYSKTNVGAAMSNAARADRTALALDAALRIGLVVGVLLSLFTDNPLPGTITITLIVLLYTANLVSKDREGFDFLTAGGLNKGVSGLIAFCVFFACFWNVFGKALGSDRDIFWQRSWTTAALLACGVVLFVNNWLTRKRDDLDDLGDVNPLSISVLSLDRPTSAKAWSFLKRNWFFFAFLPVFVLAHVDREMGWILVVVVLLFTFLATASACVQFLSHFREAITARFDRPKVLKFLRHFSGRRSEIVTALKSVRSSSARIDVLNAADSKSTEFAQQLRDPTNTWPEGERPKFEREFDDYLAMLDEAWWGLS